MQADPLLIKAVIKVESNNNPNAVGPETRYGTAKGLMQLIDSTGHEWMVRLRLGEDPVDDYQPFDPDQNVAIGSAYLSDLLSLHGGSVRKALASYNWGRGNLSRLSKRLQSASWEVLEPHLPEETREYVQKILTEYSRLLKEAGYETASEHGRVGPDLEVKKVV